MELANSSKFAIILATGLVFSLSGCSSESASQPVEEVATPVTDTPATAWEQGFNFADSLKDSYPELLASSNPDMKAMYSKGDMPSALALEVHFKFSASYKNPCGMGGMDKYPDDMNLALDFDHGCFAGLGYNLPRPR